MASNIHCPGYARATVGTSQKNYCFISIIMRSNNILCFETLQRSDKTLQCILCRFRFGLDVQAFDSQKERLVELSLLNSKSRKVREGSVFLLQIHFNNQRKLNSVLKRGVFLRPVVPRPRIYSHFSHPLLTIHG